LGFESLQHEFEDLCAAKGWKVNLIHSETTASPDKIQFQRYYDEASMLKILDIYQEDIALFGYDSATTFSGFNLSASPVALDAFFDPDEYLSLHKDVKDAGVDPYKHCLEYGIKEGRKIRG